MEHKKQPEFSWQLKDGPEIAGSVGISVCYQLGIFPALEQEGEWYFSPELPVSHEEMVERVAKAAKLVGHPPADLETFLLDVMQQNGLTMIPVSGSCREYTIAQGATVIAPEGKRLTMTVDGVEMPPEPGTYRGQVVLTVEPPEG